MMLDDVKQALRVSTNAFDAEITDLIAAARLDLQISGVDPLKAESDDGLIKRAIILYCKTNFGIDSPDAERFQDSYVMLKQHLSLSGDYS